MSARVVPIEFETERLRLRRWLERDRAPFAAMNADSEVMRYFPAVSTEAMSNEAIDRWLSDFDLRGWSNWAVELASTREFIGFIGLSIPRRVLPCTPCVEIGWRLARAHWKRGYATEGARAALRIGFERLALDEIVSFTSLLNAPSRRVIERIGLRDAHEDFDHPGCRKGTTFGATASTGFAARSGSAEAGRALRPTARHAVAGDMSASHSPKNATVAGPEADASASRTRLIAAVTDALRLHPWALAAWLGGSDANGRTDRWSDVDLVVIVEDDRVEEAFAVCASAVRSVAPIAFELRLPMPTWHGHDQVFWQLEGIPDWCMVDLVVQKRGSTATRFLEVERHGRPHILFDREGLVRPATFDREAHQSAMRARFDAMVPRFRLLQHLVRKAAWRGERADAIDRYVQYTLRPLIELCRMRHCPDRFDFGGRYLRDDLPPALREEIEAISLPGSLEALLRAQAAAEAIFERECALVQPQVI